jgi:hypothetical protein
MQRLAVTLLRPACAVPLALLVGALLPMAWVTAGPSFCPFKVATGLPCPGCGMTRSAVALLHGDFGASLYYHPLGVVIVLAAVAVALLDAWRWWQERHETGPRLATLARLMVTPAPWAAIAVIAAVWVVRLPLYAAGIWVF